MKWLHFFNKSRQKTAAEIHYIVEVDNMGGFTLFRADGTQERDQEIQNALEEFYLFRNIDPETGRYAVTYTPGSQTFSGAFVNHKRYRLVHSKGGIARLYDAETGEEEDNQLILAALEAALVEMDLNNVENGEYILDYNPKEETFHGFEGGDSGGAGASDNFEAKNSPEAVAGSEDTATPTLDTADTEETKADKESAREDTETETVTETPADLTTETFETSATDPSE